MDDARIVSPLHSAERKADIIIYFYFECFITNITANTAAPIPNNIFFMIILLRLSVLF